MAAPIVGIGASFQYGSTASPPVYTTLVGVDSITFSGDKVQVEKTTTMATASGIDTFMSSTQDNGTCDVKCFWEPGDTTQTALEAIRLSGVLTYFKANYGTSNSRVFQGIVESCSVTHTLEKPSRLDVKIKLSGPWTLA